jgi:hypothetical protein
MFLKRNKNSGWIQTRDFYIFFFFHAHHRTHHSDRRVTKPRGTYTKTYVTVCPIWLVDRGQGQGASPTYATLIAVAYLHRVPCTVILDFFRLFQSIFYNAYLTNIYHILKNEDITFG